MGKFQIGQHRADFNARQAIDRARIENLPRIFKDTILAPSPGFLTTHITNISNSMDELLSEIRDAIPLGDLFPNVGQMIQDALLELLQSADIVAEFLALIGEELVADAIALITEATPYIGIGVSAVQTVRSMIKTGIAAFNRVYLALKEKHFHAETALAALKAFEDLIERELAANLLDTGRHLSATGLKVGGCFLDFGTATTVAVGVTNAIAGLIKSLVMAGVEFLDMKYGNKYLRNPGTIDANMFSRCPILGCYYLVLADTSDLIRFMTVEIGTKGFQEKAEDLAKKIDPVRRKAEKAITKSRFVLITTKDTIPMPVKTRVDYRTRSQKIRDKIKARVLRPFMNGRVSGDAHRDLEMLKGKLIFEGKKSLDPFKVLVESKINNFKNTAKVAVPKV